MRDRWFAAAFILLLLVILARPSALAVAPEVQGLRFDASTRLEWDGQSGILGYNLYRSGAATVDGDCQQGSIQGSGADDADLPTPGAGFYYLVTAFDETGEGTAGPLRIPATPCKPARRLFPLTPNGDDGNGVEDGVDPRRNPSAISWPTGRGTVGVLLHSGETWFRALDLSIRGRSIPEHSVAFIRTYRSQVDYEGPLGHGWDFNLNARLAPLGAEVIYHDGSGRREVFARDVMSSFFGSPKGFYAVLKENPDSSFTLRNPEGTLYRFHSLVDGSNLQGALESVEDRNGNRRTLLYDHQGLLVRVVDAMGRSLSFDYDGNGRLILVTDFAGRSWQYSFDLAGDLVSARTPFVTGTPNGNDFPDGKAEAYAYASGFPDARANHNLLSVTAPNEQGSGPVRVQLDHGVDSLVFNFDRVTTLTVGGVNASGIPAGGTAALTYESLNPGGDPGDPTLPRRRATLTDRNGNLVEFMHNRDGNLLRQTDFTNRELRPGEPDYVTSFEYNSDGERLRILSPEGDETLFSYDSTGVDRYRQGNLLEVRRVAGPRGDGDGGPLNDLVTTYTYDPVYNLVRTITDPRGNDSSYVPQNGGAHNSDRYTWEWLYDHQEGDPATNGIQAYSNLYAIDLTGGTFNLGDLNGDAVTQDSSGNCVRKEAPAVALDAASNQAGIEGDTTQSIVVTYRWNAFGQIVSETDAEENVREYTYHPETDPDGDGNASPPPDDNRTLDPTTGGYLSDVVLDAASGPGRNNKTNPSPAGVQHTFLWDAVGNNTHTIDGRGVLTRRVFNALDQVVELRRAAATADASGPDGDPATGRGETGLTAFSYKVHYEYDANDNLTARRAEDDGETRAVGPELDTTYVYDLLDRRVRVTREATSTNDLVTEYRYDPNENPIRVIEPEGNEHETSYDERDLVLSVTRGASGPRGGTPAVETYAYDGNGNVVLRTDPRGNPVDYAYDGYDRVVRVVDEVGNTGQSTYDPANRVVESLLRGPVGGPTPGDRLGATNTDLERTVYLYDEMYRLFRVDAELFVPSGAPAGRPPNLTEGPLVPADGALNRIFEYDRLSRPTFVREDTGQTTRHDYDGLDRRVLTTQPDSSPIEYHYDPRDNLIELVEIEKPSLPGPPEAEFITTYEYDSLDRRVRVVDNIGQTSSAEYDSLDRVTTATDANGPAAGSINRKSPGRTGITVPINGHGNVTRHTYDGAGRLQTRDLVLTPSGLGDGTTAPAPDGSNPFNPDGLIRIELEWDDNSLLSRSIDDLLNDTTYAYDNLDRRTLTTYDDATATQHLYDENDNPVQVIDANGSVHDNTYDPANRREMTTYAAAAGVEGASQQQFEYDGLNRLTSATDNNASANANDDVIAGYVYDSLGRRIEEQQTLTDGTVVKLTGHHWQSRLLGKLIYPGDREIEYSYDAVDRLTTISDLDPGRPESATFEYFGMQRVHTRTLSNDVRTTTLNDAGDADIGYDGVRRIVNLRHLDPGNILLGGFEYRWDRGQRQIYERRAHHDLGGGNARGERYVWDSAYRLIDFQEGDLDAEGNLVAGPFDAWSFTLDGVGSWPEMTRNGETYNATPNNLNEYDEIQSGGTRVDDGVPDDFGDSTATGEADGVNLAHDEKGDQTLNDNMATAFDATSRAVRATDTVGAVDVAAYVYDSLDRRVRRQVTGLGPLDQTLRFAWTGSRLLEEREEAGSGGRDIVHAGFGVRGGMPVQTRQKIRIKLKSYDRALGGGTGSGMGSGAAGIVAIRKLETTGHELRIGGGTGSGMGSLLLASPIIKECSYDGNGDIRIPNLLDARKGGNDCRIGGGTGAGLGSAREATAYDEVIHLAPRGRALWQVQTEGSSQYVLEDGRGNTALVVDGAGPAVLERVTYDAWGTPRFEDAANNPLFDANGDFAPSSDFGTAELWGGLRYDPEYGSRTPDLNTDRGGYYNVGGGYYNPNHGRGVSLRVNGATLEGVALPGVRWAPGGLDPGSPGSGDLLAHELTHVVQQTGSNPSRARHEIVMASVRNIRAAPLSGGSGGGGGNSDVLRGGGTSTVTGVEMFRSDRTPLRAKMGLQWVSRGWWGHCNGWSACATGTTARLDADGSPNLESKLDSVCLDLQKIVVLCSGVWPGDPPRPGGAGSISVPSLSLRMNRYEEG